MPDPAGTAGLSVCAPLSDWLAEGWAQTAGVRAVEVEGAMVRYRNWGLDDTDKPGLVFVHGFLAHAGWWDHIAPRFTDRYRVIAPDFTGMGESDHRPAYSRRQYANETIAAARDAGMTRVTVVAHSFGGGSALLAASRAQNLIERVILVDSPVFRGEPQGSPEVRPAQVYPSVADALARYRLMPPGLWPNQEVLDYIARTSLRETEGGWRWKFDRETFRSMPQERLSDELRGVTLPVDFIYAANSELIGRGALRHFLDNMPGCGIPVSVPLSHHHIMIEQPIALVAALNGLLAHPRIPTGRGQER